MRFVIFNTHIRPRKRSYSAEAKYPFSEVRRCDGVVSSHYCSLSVYRKRETIMSRIRVFHSYFPMAISK